MKFDFYPFLIFSLFCSQYSSAQLTQQTADNAFTIIRMAEIYHVQPRPVNKIFSSDLFHQIITAADPDKIYFNQDDIRQLGKFQFSLDDQLLGKKDDFLKLLISLFTKKLIQTDSMLVFFTAKKFDLNLNEVYTIQDDSSFATNESTRKIKLYKLIKRNIIETISDLNSEDSTSTTTRSDSLEPAIRKKICHAFKRDVQRIRQSTDGVPGYICNAWCEQVASCYDPHTEFFTPGRRQEFQGALGDQQMQFGFSLGEGKDATEITHLKPGSPAYKSGQMHEGDELLALKWDNHEEIDVSDGSVDEINTFIDGDHGKNLTLTLKKTDGTTRKVTLQREKSEISDDNSKVRSFILQGEHRIGFIALPAFYTDWNGEEGGNSGCADDVAKEIIKLRKENIEGLILDIRYNGGGSMTEAISLAGIFIDAGPVGMTKDKEDKVFTMKDINRGSVYDGPLILLINGFSASASEMLAGTLQDYHRALIIGSPSFGKATAQLVLPLDTMFDERHMERMKTASNYIKMTIERLYRVNGTSAQLTGVVPDIFLPDYTEAESEREKSLPFALPNITMAPNKYYHPYPPLVSDDLKIFSKNYTDTCQFFSSFKRYLEVLIQAQATHDEVLVISKMQTERNQLRKKIINEEKLMADADMPYTIQWNQYEKQRMLADEDLRKLNMQLSNTLSHDTGVLLGYQIASRMSHKQ
jgi:carboxyl-terminal processing protease